MLATKVLKAAPMLAFLILCAPAAIMFHEFLLRPSANFALLFHEACLSLSPESRHRNAYQAIVCGANLPLNDFAKDFRVTGLLHVLVVSGSHFIFLEQLLEFALDRLSKRFRWMSAVVLTALLLFALTTRLQAPVVRAFLNLALGRLNSYHQLAWTHAQRTAMSGLFSFAFCHDAQDAHSLLLSWGAALALASFPRSESGFSTTTAQLHRVLQSLLRNVWIYVILTPFLVPMGTPHPGTILLNWLIAPFMGLVLFPASLTVFFLPPLQLPCDWLWTGVDSTVSFFAEALGDSLNSVFIPTRVLWVYLAALNSFLLVRDLAEKRKRISGLLEPRR